MQINTCPNCSAEIKGGVFNSNKLLRPSASMVINYANNTNSSAFCEKCGHHLLGPAEFSLHNKIGEIRATIVRNLSQIIVATIYNPPGWSFDVLGVSTAQSVTGTGVFSELSMSFSDLFGSESSTMNAKIEAAEHKCLERIRKKAWDMGGNAVVGLDIDYSEVGSLRGMMMVCCTGTVVRVKDTTVFSDETKDAINLLTEKSKELDRLDNIYHLHQTGNT